MSKIALIKGDSRYENIFAALKTIETEIKEKIAGKRRIVLKPNFVSTTVPLAASSAEAAKAVLDFLKSLTKEKIIIAEGAAHNDTDAGFKNLGYYELAKDYRVEFVDLNCDKTIDFEIFSSDLKLFRVKIAKTIFESDFRISLALLKTHDTVVATLSLKNLVVGALPEKSLLHQGYKAINLSLAKLAEVIPPHLSVIDGFVGMEGDGPIYGAPVEMKVALAGTDFLAVDTAASRLMGFDISQIGYLYYCREKGLGEGDLSRIEIIGNVSLEEAMKKFALPPTFEKQLNWH